MTKMQSTKPVRKCVSARYQPPSTNQRMLPQPEPSADAPDHKARQLERLNAERDGDDENAAHDPRDYVGDEQPDPGEYEPDDVADCLHALASSPVVAPDRSDQSSLCTMRASRAHGQARGRSGCGHPRATRDVGITSPSAVSNAVVRPRPSSWQAAAFRP